MSVVASLASAAGSAGASVTGSAGASTGSATPRPRLGGRLGHRLGGRFFRHGGLRVLCGLRRVCFRGLAELLDPSVDEPDEVAERRREETDELAQRRDDHADELALDDLRGGQLGERLDVRLADRASSEQAAPEREHLRVPRRVGERLRDGDRVAVRLDERDRGRSLEQGEQRLGARRLCGPPRESVLHDLEPRAAAAQLRAELLELGVRQAAIVRDDQRLGRPELLGELGDDLFLLGSLHVVPSGNDQTRHEAGPGRAS